MREFRLCINNVPIPSVCLPLFSMEIELFIAEVKKKYGYLYTWLIPGLKMSTLAPKWSSQL